MNKRTLVMEETLHVSFDESPPHTPTHANEDDDKSPFVDVSNIPDTNNVHNLPRDSTFVRDHPQDQVIGDVARGVQTRSSLVDAHVAFISLSEPKRVDDALKDEFWVLAMQEELLHFERNEVGNLYPNPKTIPSLEQNGS